MWIKLVFWSMESRKYIQISKLSKTQFRRYIGVNLYVFELMVLVVQEYEYQLKVKTGRSNNLCIEDQVLMLLEYY